MLPQYSLAGMIGGGAPQGLPQDALLKQISDQGAMRRKQALAEMLQPKPEKQGGGLGDALGDIASIAKFAMMFI